MCKQQAAPDDTAVVSLFEECGAGKLPPPAAYAGKPVPLLPSYAGTPPAHLFKLRSIRLRAELEVTTRSTSSLTDFAFLR